MSTWKDILEAAARGDQQMVDDYLRERLPLELRHPSENRTEGLSSYDGPIVKAVVNSFKTIDSAEEREFANLCIDEVVDYITDQIIDKVKRTADIVTFCRLNPALDTEQVAESFTGWSGLKRGKPELVTWVTDHLASMVEIGIPLPGDSLAVREASSVKHEQILGFEERALIKKWDVKKSWNAFRKQQGILAGFVCIDESADDDVAGESTDYGIISESRLLVHNPLPDGQKLLEMADLAAQIEDILDEILTDLTTRKPQAGYNPIAWHNTWWSITDKYSGLPLNLRLELPCCETDQILSDHIVRHYVDFLAISRLSVQRRRTQLTEKCEGAIIAAVRSYLDH
jgi:hypothetical protein